MPPQPPLFWPYWLTESPKDNVTGEFVGINVILFLCSYAVGLIFESDGSGGPVVICR